jgi:hypothetical protein
MLNSMENSLPNYLPPPERCSDEALIEMAQIIKTSRTQPGIHRLEG